MFEEQFSAVYQVYQRVLLGPKRNKTRLVFFSIISIWLRDITNNIEYPTKMSEITGIQSDPDFYLFFRGGHWRGVFYNSFKHVMKSY